MGYVRFQLNALIGANRDLCTRIFSGDLLQSYKPNPATYLGACKYLQLDPSEVGMVVSRLCHLGLLRLSY